MAIQQPRPQELEGVTPMLPEVEIKGLTLPVEVSDDGVITVRQLDGFLVDRHIGDCGRTCYQTNDKSTAARDTSLIHDMANSGHTSVFEHASITICIRGGSRSFTHQEVRHRHQAISQESQRYCDHGNYGVIIPPSIQEANLVDDYMAIMNRDREDYLRLQAMLNQAKKAGKLAPDRKTNEDARFVLPNAVQSEIVISPNLTELRNMFFKRITTHAQWEIRDVFRLILEKVVMITCVYDDIYEYYLAHDRLLDGFTITV